MSTLAEFIKAKSGTTMTAHASAFGVSRPYLYSLCDGTRSPSFKVAKRIEAASDGAVPVQSWPKFAEIMGAA